jgi:adenylate cyclase
VAPSPFQSVRRRFVRKFGVSFFWATMVGSVLGAAVYFRVPRNLSEEPPAWHQLLRQWVERAELITFDWRQRALGEQSVRSDEVVLATIDDDTLASAREAANAALAVRPWPRELYGSLAEQALREGAGMVLLDVPVSDLSPRTCIPCRGDKARSDDDLLGSKLEKIGSKVVLPVRWSSGAPRPPDRELKPWLVKVGEYELAQPPLQAVQRVLAGRTQAFLIPAGNQLQLWAAAATEARAQALGLQFDLKVPLVRAQTPDDSGFEVGASWLTARSAEVTVEGLDPTKLSRARTIFAPVAPLLAPGVGLGTARVAADLDGQVRDFPHLVATEIDGKLAVIASAPLLAAMRLTGTPQLRWADGTLFIGDRFSVPMNENGRTVITWDAAEVGSGGRGSLKRAVPVWRLLLNLEDDENKRGVRHHDNELGGRVVVLSEVGAPEVSTAIGPLTPGAVMGQALVNLLHSRSPTRTDPLTDFWFVVVFAFGGAFLAVSYSGMFPRSGWVGNLIAIALVAVAHGFVARNLFLSQLRWVPMAAPILAASFTFLASLGYARTLERSLRDFVTRALGRALHPEVLGRVESDVGLMRPERLPIAVYFSDIEGFTALSQKLDPKVLVDLLQDYLREMTEVVIEGRGQVDKYLGDGVMAFWGAPVRLASPAQAACQAALKMRARFDRRRKSWEKTAGITLVFRSGLDIGETLVGEMGTEHRLNYTVMGESVATAAKLEALSKKYGALILCTENVQKAAGEGFVFRDVDRVRLHRHEAPITVFELLGDVKQFADVKGTLQKWQAALAAYRGRRFTEAREAFVALAALGNDALATRYVKRCEAFEAQPPPEGWDGVFERAEP